MLRSPRSWVAVVSVLLLAGLAGAGLAACGSDQGSPGGDDGGGADGTVGPVDGLAPDAPQGEGGPGAVDGGDGGGDAADGASATDGACVPLTCPSTYTCGPLDDRCGNVIQCGVACTGGQICEYQAGDGGQASQSCVSKSTVCTGKCGFIVDACKVGINCGGCANGLVCDGTTNTCVPPTPSDAGGCQGGAPSCTGQGGVPLCGTIGNGCGQTTHCTCPTGQTCGGNGIPGECGTPVECQDPNNCGTFKNTCGSATVTCGNCAPGSKCDTGTHTCQPCTPNSNACQGLACGNVNDGCEIVSCGKCTGEGVCEDGGCCTPKSCAALEDAGVVTGCDPVPNGCGGSVDCAPCGTTDRCVSNVCTPCPPCDGGVCNDQAQCCFPETCASFPDAGCQPQALGCGKAQVCNPCPGGDVCLNDGTCCTPIGCEGRSGVVDDGCGDTINCGGP
jgi:hypothetical protein